MILASQNSTPNVGPAGRAQGQARAAHPTRRALGLTLAAVAIGVALPGCAWIDLKRRELALRPTPGRPASLPPATQLFPPGDERWLSPVPRPEGSESADQQLALRWLPRRDPNAPTLLYLHSTFRNLYQSLSKIETLRAAGFSVLAVDYRDWGDSSPIVPSEETIGGRRRTRLGRNAAASTLARPARDLRPLGGHGTGGAPRIHPARSAIV